MRRWLTALCLLLAGCAATSSVSQPQQTEPPLPQQSSSPRAAPTYRSICQGFRDFYGVMASRPPSEQQGRLIDLATAVDQAPGSAKLHRLADALVSYVSTSSFPHEGNLDGEPVQRLSDVCL